MAQTGVFMHSSLKGGLKTQNTNAGFYSFSTGSYGTRQHGYFHQWIFSVKENRLNLHGLYDAARGNICCINPPFLAACAVIPAAALCNNDATFTAHMFLGDALKANVNVQAGVLCWAMSCYMTGAVLGGCVPLSCFTRKPYVLSKGPVGQQHYHIYRPPLKYSDRSALCTELLHGTVPTTFLQPTASNRTPFNNT